jgi:hypothetical protein
LHGFFANKTLVWLKFAGAEYLHKSNKIWLGFVQCRGNLPYGQVNFRNTKIPWLEAYLEVTEERKKFLMSFLHKPFGEISTCLVSADGRVTRLIDVLSDKEANELMHRLTTKSNIGEIKAPIEGDKINEQIETTNEL